MSERERIITINKKKREKNPNPVSKNEKTNKERENENLKEKESEKEIELIPNKNITNSFDKESSEKQILDEENKEEEEESSSSLSEDEIISFKYEEYITNEYCTSHYFGEIPIFQQSYVCTACNPEKNQKLCKYCYDKCHKKCRRKLEIIRPELVAAEKLKNEKFACFCGTNLKHIPTKIEIKSLIPCLMMTLDRVLGVDIYFCHNHSIVICGICSVFCHKNCKVEMKDNISDIEKFKCHCYSERHTNYNEIAFSFPIEDYKKASGAIVWPIQILNLLFQNKNTFFKMRKLFIQSLENNNLDKNGNLFSKKFYRLLQLFSGTFNRKFRSYYYHKDLESMFEYNKVFDFIQRLEMNNKESTLTKFRLLFIILFIHLRKDFQILKSLTSIDFMSSSVIDRLRFKKMLKCDNVFNEYIYEKYKIAKDNNSIKKFVLENICQLITKGMEFVKIEENSNEFEIGIKILCFMMKRMMFNKQDLILLINSLFNFHLVFFDYIMSEKKNIYPLIEIFSGIVELCYMITVNYNDLVIEEYLDKKGAKKFNKGEIKDFIHTKSEFGAKLFCIIMKNSKIMTKHFNLIPKPSPDKKSIDEIKNEKLKLEHKLNSQEINEKNTTGIPIRMPLNGGLFMEKIIYLYNESLSMFCLADNYYYLKLEDLTKDEILSYYKFCEDINKKDFYDIVLMTPKKYQSNILYNLKISLEAIYNELFTSDYLHIEKVDQKIQTRILNSIDLINQSLNRALNVKKFIKIYENYYNEKKIKSEEKKIETDYNKINIQNFKKKIINQIKPRVIFLNHQLIEIEEILELIVDNFITSQVDETIMKGMYFLTNINYPNLLNENVIQIIFDFLQIFLLTKRGTQYFLTGKNLQRLRKCLNRFSIKRDDSNINESLGRVEEFNLKCMKICIHFFNELITASHIYNIKTIANHKIIPKIKLSLINHLKNFIENIESDEESMDFKQELSEIIPIYFNLHKFFSYDDFEEIKCGIIDIFFSSPTNLKDGENFCKWFDNKLYDIRQEAIEETRELELNIYFQFFEIITKNTFFCYGSDKNMKNRIKQIQDFILLDNYLYLFENSKLFNIKQKEIILRLVRTFFLIDYLDPIDYNKMKHHLRIDEFKNMIYGNLINDEKITQYISKDVKKDLNQTKKNLLIEKYEQIKKFSTIIQLLNLELKKFPGFMVGEKIENIISYVNELVFGLQSITNFIYSQKRFVSKIIPEYFILVITFLSKKINIIHLLNDIKTTGTYNPDYLKNLINQKEPLLDEIQSNNFNIFNKNILCKIVMEGIYEIFSLTKINEDYSLKSYLEYYDKMAEANFTPFSLLETRDYEYFYDETKSNEILTEDPSNYKIARIKNEYTKQFTRVSTTNFLNVIQGVYTEHKMDYGEMLVIFFQSFLNSVDSKNSVKYRNILCLMTKMLFYNTEEMQTKFHRMIYDSNFFSNFNRSLNINIVLTIDCSKNFTLIQRTKELTDITKITIQFLQLLGEGFNTDYHENIMTNKVINKKKKKEDESDSDSDLELNIENNNNNTSDNISISNTNNTKTNLNEESSLIDTSSQGSKSKKGKKKTSPNTININRTIYETVIINLMRIYHLMDLTNPIEAELPFDKLCVLTSNLIDFVIEYIHTKNELNEVVDQNIVKLIFGTGKLINYKENPYEYLDNKGVKSIFVLNLEDDFSYEKEYKIRNTMICFVKNKYYQLLYNYLLIGGKDFFVHLLLNKGFGPVELFKEILQNMRNLIKKLIKINPINNLYIAFLKTPNSLYETLINLYKNDFYFNEGIELSVTLQIYLVLKTYEETYNINILREHFEIIEYPFLTGERKKIKNSIIDVEEEIKQKNISPIKKEYYQTTIFRDIRETPYQKVVKNYNKILENEKKNSYKKDDLKDLLHFIPMHSPFALATYKFLETVILKVEIRKEENEISDNSNIDDFTSKIADKIILERNKLNKKEEKNIDEKNNNKIILEDKKPEKKNTANSFFIKQSFTFHLSKNSKNFFLKNVDRTNATTKYMDLLAYSDYFIFEMLYNDHIIGSSKLFKEISEISLIHLEIINFIFIVLNNILFIIHFYKSPSLPVDKYDYYDKTLDDKLFSDIMVISIIHICYIILVMVIWFYFRFPLSFERNLLLSTNKTFIFRKRGIIDQNIVNPIILDGFKGEAGIFKVMRFINKNIGFFKYIYILLLKSILFNPEICFFLYCILLNVLYYFTKSPICIAFEMIFIANLIPTLKNIFKAITLKFSSLIITILFTYILVYLFSWIAYFYMSDIFNIEVLDYKSGEIIKENFCTSSLQCYLYILSYGTRSGGGIIEELPMMTYRNGVSFFIQRFFFDLLFFFFVVMIMGNVSFGIIIDTFGELRDKNVFFENDRKNICFICQLSRDDCLVKNINFDKHIKLDHNIWNYVYFLTYLHLNNPNDFNINEGNVWDKLFENDYSWIPIENKNDNENNNDN